MRCGRGSRGCGVLEIAGISKSFGGFRAVSDVSLSVATVIDRIGALQVRLLSPN